MSPRPAIPASPGRGVQSREEIMLDKLHCALAWISVVYLIVCAFVFVAWISLKVTGYSSVW